MTSVCGWPSRPFLYPKSWPVLIRRSSATWSRTSRSGPSLPSRRNARSSMTFSRCRWALPGLRSAIALAHSVIMSTGADSMADTNSSRSASEGFSESDAMIAGRGERSSNLERTISIGFGSLVAAKRKMMSPFSGNSGFASICFT